MPSLAARSPAEQEHEGELTIVATGPLTNIALASKFDESFPQKGRGLQRPLVVMPILLAVGTRERASMRLEHCSQS